MDAFIGVLLALAALVSWGVADFLIQRSARLVGSAKTMFLIGITLVIGLLPFVYQDIFRLSAEELTLLVLTGVALTVASLFDFEALKAGKMAVAEPIIGLETPITVVFAVLFIGEHLSTLQTLIIVGIVAGTVLIATERFVHLKYHRRIFEKGVLLSIIAAAGLASANVLVGESSQQLTPYLAIWWVGIAHALVCTIFLLSRREFVQTFRDVKKHPWTLLGQAIIDDIAWITFAGATVFIPISIATAISSGYIALAVLLGIFITKERVRMHQKLGIVLVTAGIIALSYLYG
jgi:transporter family protein